MIVSEELAATATKMFDAQQQARKYWIQSHRKITRKAGQVGLDIQDDDATSHRTNAVKMLLQKLYGKTHIMNKTLNCAKLDVVAPIKRVQGVAAAHIKGHEHVRMVNGVRVKEDAQQRKRNLIARVYYVLNDGDVGLPPHKC